MISIDCWLLQNCWQPNFIHVMWRSRSQKFWKLGVEGGHFVSDSATPPALPANPGLTGKITSYWSLFVAEDFLYQC